MSAVQDILSSLNIDQLAERLGTTPDEARQATENALPALLGGLQANAADPSGAASITEALAQHGSSLVDGGVNLDDVDVADGERIASHIFGGNQEAVVNQLGGLAGGAGLVGKLLPMLAPVVMSWISSRMSGGGQSQAAQEQGGGDIADMLGGLLGGGGGQGGGIGDILGGLLGGGQSQGSSSGGGIMDMLGGLLGGGRR